MSRIKLNCNYPYATKAEEPYAMRKAIRNSIAETAIMNSLVGSSTQFQEIIPISDNRGGFAIKAVQEKFINDFCQGAHYEKRTIGILVDPRQLIGLGDVNFTLFPVNPTIKYIYLEDSDTPTGTVLYMRYDLSQCREEIVSDPSLIDLNLTTPILHIPRTNNGLLMPMLGLYALYLSSLHGKTYSVEAAVDEIYHLGLVKEPDFSDERMPSPKMPLDTWSPTAPEYDSKTLARKYNTTLIFQNEGKNHDSFSIGILDQDGNYIPVSFWKCANCAIPITLPCPQTQQTPIFKLSRTEESPIYLSEFINLAVINNTYTLVVSWYGGENNLKYADFTPLNGKKVIYLVIRADDESDERAYRVMLKAFARAYKCGNRSFEALIWDTQETIPYATLLSQAVERGYLEVANVQANLKMLMASSLPWPNKEPGIVLFGRAYQSGRIHLIVAARGVGKTEMQLLFAVMAVNGASIDKAFFENRLGKPFRVLYIQSEMSVKTDFMKDRIPTAERLLGRNNDLKTTAILEIDFHQADASLVNEDEQLKILKKLSELDPNGQYQWMMVIDSLRTEMPEVLNGGNIFKDHVFPWLDFLRKKGIAISLLHHENQEGTISGPGSIQDLSDMVIHITRTNKITVNGEADVEIIQEKKRLLKGKQQATAHWNWVTNEKDIVVFTSEYYDDDAPSDTHGAHMANDKTEANSDCQSSKEEAPTNGEAVTGTEEESNDIRLPKSLTELQAMPREQMTVALHELWCKHGTHDKIAEALGCSISSLNSLLKDCNVNRDTHKEYLAKRNGYK